MASCPWRRNLKPKGGKSQVDACPHLDLHFWKQMSLCLHVVCLVTLMTDHPLKHSPFLPTPISRGLMNDVKTLLEICHQPCKYAVLKQ